MRFPILTAGSLALALALAGAVRADAPAEKPALRAVYAKEGVAPELGDWAWRQAPEAKLPLMAQLITPPVGGGSVGEARVRAMHDGESLAILLDWPDASADRSVSVNGFRDAVAVGFPIAESDSPLSPFMGDPEHPVAIWQWTADLEAEARGPGAFADRYPHTQGVWYFPQDDAVRRQVRAWRGSDPVVEFVATGWGTLTRRESGEVSAASRHDGKRWRVLLRRRLATGNPEHASFQPGGATQLIVAIWDGAKGEVHGRKSVTLTWTPFTLDATVGDHARR